MEGIQFVKFIFIFFDPDPDSCLAFQNAISGGRPPIPLAWDVELSAYVLDSLWEEGVGWLLHWVLPECPDPRYSSYIHPPVPLTGSERQYFFENFDFSTFLFRPRHVFVFTVLFDFFNWLISEVENLLLLFCVMF